MLPITSFIKTITHYYEEHRRDLPWRRTTSPSPYHILVSEMMLQQTQVSRVLIKYKEFIKKFPSFKALSQAQIVDVLKVWKGLGYNRRAFFIKRIADEIIMNPMYKKKFPADYRLMLTLPGIGQSTAGAISAFSFNKKVPFIETNIRTVIQHAFFKNKKIVSDKDILTVLNQCLDKLGTMSARDWYYALYDYGTMLKSSLGKKRQVLHSKQKSYRKQSAFIGSSRQLRAVTLQHIVESHPRHLTLRNLTTFITKLIAKKQIPNTFTPGLADKIQTVLDSMTKEGQIMHDANKAAWRIPPRP